MTHLIDKSALVEEIKKFIERAEAERVLYPKTIRAAKNYLLIEDYKKLLSFIDTFEVKEVDLEKLVNDYFTGWYFDSELDILAKPNNYSATIDDVKEIAKHFFELGLKAKQKGE